MTNKGSNPINQALYSSAFFVLVSLIVNSLLLSQTQADDTRSIADFDRVVPCKLGLGDFARLQQAHVRWVYDADTVMLEDKRKIRLIGIDAPEVKHHDQPGEPFGAEATEALRERLKRFFYQVYLDEGPERLDRYGRALLHLYFPDGNSVSAWLLSIGFARALAIPPNVTRADCYAEAEHSAQKQRLGIWHQATHSLQKASRIPFDYRGFIRLEARVAGVKFRRRSVEIELHGNPKRPIVIIIQSRNSHYFKQRDLANLVERTIRVQGKLRLQRDRRIVYLNHPSQWEIVAVHRQDNG